MLNGCCVSEGYIGTYKLLMLNATVLGCAGGCFCSKPVTMVLLMLCSAVSLECLFCNQFV